MKLKKTLLTFTSAAILGLATLASVGCGGSGSFDIGGDDTTQTITVTPDSEQWTDDLTLDEDGNIDFDGVEIKMWSIVGSPDDVVFKKLVDQFNNEFLGYINLSVTYIGHYDFYGQLETTWANDAGSLPDCFFMHNEKTYQYASKGYLHSFSDEFFEKSQAGLDFSQVYSNIDRVTKAEGTRFAVPIDAHGFLTYMRQDIVKKNGLGFDNNTRFAPKTRAEYEQLLKGLREKADAGTLLVRNVNKGENHAWKTANATLFRPSFSQSTDPDGLGALYSNGDKLLSEDGKTVTFQNSKGYQTYLTDQVTRWNKGYIGETGTNTAQFGTGEICMFNEGPWWASQTYDPTYNNSDLTKVGQLGITQEDANEYAKPFLACNTAGWWTIDENLGKDTANKWYGNGHAVSINKNTKSLTKAAAIMKFVEWFTQEQNSSGVYHLAEWTKGGHLPAWKNVFADESYKKIAATNVTLQALGDPENIIAMEPVASETTVFNGFAQAAANVIAALKGTSGCTEAQALQILEDAAQSVQVALDYGL